MEIATALIGNFEGISGEVLGHRWENPRPIVGKFEDINGAFRGH